MRRHNGGGATSKTSLARLTYARIESQNKGLYSATATLNWIVRRRDSFSNVFLSFERFGGVFFLKNISHGCSLICGHAQIWLLQAGAPALTHGSHFEGRRCATICGLTVEEAAALVTPPATAGVPCSPAPSHPFRPCNIDVPSSPVRLPCRCTSRVVLFCVCRVTRPLFTCLPASLLVGRWRRACHRTTDLTPMVKVPALALCLSAGFSVLQSHDNRHTTVPTASHGAATLVMFSLCCEILRFEGPSAPRCDGAGSLVGIARLIVSRSLSVLHAVGSGAAVVRQPNGTMETLWRSRVRTRPVLGIIFFFSRNAKPYAVL